MNYNHYKVEIDGRDCTAQVPFPIKFSQLLDEQLDEASISIIRTKRKIFNPLTPVKITLWNGNTPSNDIVLDMIVASDNANELPVGSGKFNHELYLIEETKILEGFIVRSHGYVNTLNKEVGGMVVFPEMHIISSAHVNWELPEPLVWEIRSPITQNVEVFFPSGYDLFGEEAIVEYYNTSSIPTTNNATKVKVYNSLGNFATASEVTIKGVFGETIDNSLPVNNSFLRSKFSCVFHAPGDYEVVYYLLTGSSSGYGEYYTRYSATYKVSVLQTVDLQAKRQGWNARSVVGRALTVAEFIRKNSTPRFSLDGNADIKEVNPNYIGEFASENELPQSVTLNQVAWIGTSPEDGYAIKYYDPYNTGFTSWLPTYETFEATTGLSGTAAKLQFIKTPEFQFTQSTLREILQGVGSFIHAEPRLKNGVIFYDFYGSGEQSEKVFKRYGSQQLQLNMERFVTGIDSSVENLTNSLGYAKGVVVEPYYGGFKNVVAESNYVRVDEGNCFADTQFPIRRLIKVECYSDEISGTSPSNPVDITNYVLEYADYTQLSSYSGTLAKANALYYTTGEKGIRGLNVKLNTAVFQSFQNYAIINIISTVKNMVFSPSNAPNIANIKFRITYEPITATRVKQSKASIVNVDIQRDIAYTQNQNLIESQYYGEHLKGVIARMGNPDKVLTVVERGLVLPPKIGTVYEIADGDYYVSAAAVEVNTTTTKITLTLSKDFNKYSDYVGINSMKRQYEISEKQAFDSHFNYRDYCIVGDLPAKTDNDVLFVLGASLNVPYIVSKIFTQKAELYNDTKYVDKKISFATLSGIDFVGNPLDKILLSVISYPMGNSAVFSCRYEDNYSAGVQIAEEEIEDGVIAYFTNGTKYTDGYGEIDLLNIAYFSSIDWNENELSADALISKISKSLPAASIYSKNAIMGNVLSDGTPDNNPLLISKGSTEVPTINYQIDFVANRNSIVIGSALAKNLPMVSGLQPDHYASLYVLQKRINKFEPIVDLSAGEAIKLRDYSNGSGLVINNYKTISFNNWSSSIDGKAWALVDNATGELLIGENKEIKAGENVFGANGLHISFTHDIYKKGE